MGSIRAGFLKWQSMEAAVERIAVKASRHNQNRRTIARDGVPKLRTHVFLAPAVLGVSRIRLSRVEQQPVKIDQIPLEGEACVDFEPLVPQIVVVFQAEPAR